MKMANFYVVKDDKVENIIVAESKEVAEAVTGLPCYEYEMSNQPNIGWEFDGKSFVKPKIDVTLPVEGEAKPPSK